LLLEASLRDRGVRDRVEIVVSTPQPLTLPVAGPDASRYVADELTRRGVTVLTGHQVAGVDPDSRTVRFADGQTLDFRILLGVPAAAPSPVVAASALAGPSGWIQPDRYTFATSVERVYAVGDCTLVPTANAQLPKAGVFAEAAGKVAAANLAADLYGGDRARFDGHGFCFLELPDRQVATVTGDFYAEPTPDVRLEPAGEANHRAKQQWEQERLTGWLG
jgi:sulfide:quinone oxidoreductase